MPDGTSAKRTYPTRRRIHSFDSSVGEIERVAQALYETDPDWLTFFREIFGVDGAIRRVFLDPDELSRFERSDACQRIRGLMNDLRGRRRIPEEREPEKMITIRLPASIHSYLLSEAEARGTSMNKLCIARLVQMMDEPTGDEADPPATP